MATAIGLYGNTMATAIHCQEAEYGKVHNVPDGQAAVSTAALWRLIGERGWTLNRLSRESRIDYSTLYRIAHGIAKNPRHETVAKLANTLGVSTDVLSEAVDSVVTAEDDDEVIRRAPTLLADGGRLELASPATKARLAAVLRELEAEDEGGPGE